jgi:mRNA interferase RelE/StbE
VNYRVNFSASARRAIKVTLPQSAAAALWEFIIRPLAQNPVRLSKPLLGELASSRSARRGGYRVVFSLSENANEIYIERIAARKNIYR